MVGDGGLDIQAVLSTRQTILGNRGRCILPRFPFLEGILPHLRQLAVGDSCRIGREGRREEISNSQDRQDGYPHPDTPLSKLSEKCIRLDPQVCQMFLS